VEEMKRWTVSGMMTGLHCLAGAALTKALLFLASKKNCCSQLLRYFGGIERQLVFSDSSSFVDPSFLCLARFWQDPIGCLFTSLATFLN